MAYPRPARRPSGVLKSTLPRSLWTAWSAVPTHVKQDMHCTQVERDILWHVCTYDMIWNLYTIPCFLSRLSRIKWKGSCGCQYTTSHPWKLMSKNYWTSAWRPKYIYFDIGATSNSDMMKSQSAQLRRFKECHEQTTLIQIQLATMRPERKYESE